MTEGVRTTCPYCGVGCGVVARPDGRIVGDPGHPANRGRLCSKGSALVETLDDADRLLHPTIRGARATWDEALDLIAARFAATAAEHGPDSVALYVSGQCLTEDYYVANKLMKGFVGTSNIDTNSRLCMASAVAAHVRAFGEDVVPATYDDLDVADLVVLVGSNLAWCHPVLHHRLRDARARRGTKVVVVDPRATASVEDADLHLPLAPGSDVALFAGLLVHLADADALDHAWLAAHATGLGAAIAEARRTAPDLATVAAITGLRREDIARFYDLFAATPRTVTAFSMGVNQSAAGTDKANAIINAHLATGRIGKPGAAPFSITGQPNAMGGREVGGLANQLAAHMRFDDPADLDALRRFWNAPNLVTGPGLKAVDLFDAVLDGRVKALWIMATNPADSMPRVGRVRDALRACPFVVVSDLWPTDTTAHAHVLLPAAGWGEKDGTVTNSERMISRQRPFRVPPGEARPDWWALAQVGQRMGWPGSFAWTTPAEVFAEHATLSGTANDGRRAFDISGLAGADYDALPPTRWPVPASAPAKGAPSDRPFANGRFPTPDGRARLVPTPYRAPAARPDAEYPFTLNTGRVRDQWHTMTRTGRVPRLMGHRSAPTAVLHPRDAARLGLARDTLVRLTTPHGTTVLRAATDTAQRPGEIFVPMHWTDAFASAGPVGRLVGAATDPISGQPELKATPVRAEPVETAWRGLLLHRRAVRPSGTHWSRIPVGSGHVLDLAGESPLPLALDAFAGALMEAPSSAERIELADPKRGAWRFAALHEGRLEAALFLTTNIAALPDAAALASLLDTPVTDAARGTILAGRAVTSGPADRAVCACFGVGLNALRAAILDRRLTTTEAVGAALGAGTNCGSCLPEIREVLRHAHAPAAA